MANVFKIPKLTWVLEAVGKWLWTSGRGKSRGVASETDFHSQDPVKAIEVGAAEAPPANCWDSGPAVLCPSLPSSLWSFPRSRVTALVHNLHDQSCICQASTILHSLPGLVLELPASIAAALVSVIWTVKLSRLTSLVNSSKSDNFLGKA